MPFLLIPVTFIPAILGFINLLKSVVVSSYWRVRPIVGCQAIIVTIFVNLIRYAPKIGSVSNTIIVKKAEPIDCDGKTLEDFTYVYSIYTSENWAYLIYAIGSFLIWSYILRKYNRSYFWHILFIHYFFFWLAFVAITFVPMDRAVETTIYV